MGKLVSLNADSCVLSFPLGISVFYLCFLQSVMQSFKSHQNSFGVFLQVVISEASRSHKLQPLMMFPIRERGQYLPLVKGRFPGSTVFARKAAPPGEQTPLLRSDSVGFQQPQRLQWEKQWK